MKFNSIKVSIVLSMAAVVSSFSPVCMKKRMEVSVSLTLDGQEIRGPITPLGNFVLVETKDTLAATGGGILLPDQV